MSARDAVIKVLGDRKRPLNRDELLKQVMKLTNRNLEPQSLAVVISNLRREGFQITRGPNFSMV